MANSGTVYWSAGFDSISIVVVNNIVESFRIYGNGVFYKEPNQVNKRREQ